MKVLALDVGGTAIKSALVVDSNIEISYEFPSNAKLGGPHLLENIHKVINHYQDFDVIGISTTGQVDSENGCIIYANENVPNYTGTNLKKLLSEKYNKPVFVENDVNAAALGECFYGAGKSEDNFLCLTYGTGIGGAIIINNQIFKGAFGSAGEFGHIITHPNGATCSCGQKGCYEHSASTTALVRNISKQFPALNNGRIIFEEFHKGNDSIKGLIDEWIDEIVYGLVSLVHIFNPSLIVLGGGIMSQPYILEEIDKKVHEKIMSSFLQVKIRGAKLDNNAGIYGMVAIIENEHKNPKEYNKI